ncbi:hypothetical protein B0H16DRAFT_1780614 [Mycena metata]|uniref:Uncharacterized protein n=1 Tax=Mycena metata TaxID=1033252 RepID=A0AAD7MQ97_9AGAR|nr:hypothetical protein B0H16DRAFT_1780614 [Mycena metata]
MRGLPPFPLLQLACALCAEGGCARSVLFRESCVGGRIGRLRSGAVASAGRTCVRARARVLLLRVGACVLLAEVVRMRLGRGDACKPRRCRDLWRRKWCARTRMRSLARCDGVLRAPVPPRRGWGVLKLGFVGVRVVGRVPRRRAVCCGACRLSKMGKTRALRAFVDESSRTSKLRRDEFVDTSRSLRGAIVRADAWCHVRRGRARRSVEALAQSHRAATEMRSGCGREQRDADAGHCLARVHVLTPGLAWVIWLRGAVDAVDAAAVASGLGGVRQRHSGASVDQRYSAAPVVGGACDGLPGSDYALRCVAGGVRVARVVGKKALCEHLCFRSHASFSTGNEAFLVRQIFTYSSTSPRIHQIQSSPRRARTYGEAGARIPPAPHAAPAEPEGQEPARDELGLDTGWAGEKAVVWNAQPRLLRAVLALGCTLEEGVSDPNPEAKRRPTASKGKPKTQSPTRKAKGKVEKWELELDCLTSSIGTYTAPWVQAFRLCAAGRLAGLQAWLDRGRKKTPQQGPTRVLFPTLETVRGTALGEGGAGTVFCRRGQWEKIRTLDDRAGLEMRDAKSRSGPVGMHTKMILATLRDPPQDDTDPEATDSNTDPNATDPDSSDVEVVGIKSKRTEADEGEKCKPHGWIYVGVAQFHAERVGVHDGEWVQPGAYCNQLRGGRRPQTRDGGRCGGGDRAYSPKDTPWYSSQSANTRQFFYSSFDSRGDPMYMSVLAIGANGNGTATPPLLLTGQRRKLE